MILGFKTGPKNFPEGQAIATDLGARMCEIWFNVNKHEEYTDIIAWLQKEGVAMGLHHWGVIDGTIKTNLATQDSHIRNTTIEQIKKTIDIGSVIGCVYVNVHPGAQAIETINFTDWEQKMLPNAITPADTAKNLLLSAAQELGAYAQEKGVLLTIESITAREASRETNREDAYDPGNTPLSTLEALGAQGNFLANDISHTGTHALVEEASPEAAWEKVLDFSKRTAAQTKLLHLNIITPPYNGTDSHDGITDADFAQETFPNKEQTREFLRLFQNRNDVYAVLEPKEDPGKNYLALKAFAENL